MKWMNPSGCQKCGLNVSIAEEHYLKRLIPTCQKDCILLRQPRILSKDLLAELAVKCICNGKD